MDLGAYVKSWEPKVPMSSEARELYIKTYNYIIDEEGQEPDKYEIQDALSALLDIYNGEDPVRAFVDAFDLVHGIDISEDFYLSRLALCGGFNWKDILDNEWIYKRYEK